MTIALIDDINIILQVETSQLDTFKRRKIQLTKQKYVHMYGRFLMRR